MEDGARAPLRRSYPDQIHHPQPNRDTGKMGGLS